MAQQKTSDSRLASKYGGGYITIAQRAAEIVCENYARWKKIKLKDKFWNEKFWKQKYLRQVQVAYQILQKYDADILISILSENQFICTLMNKKVYELLKKKQNKRPEPVAVVTEAKRGPEFNSKKSIADMLD